MSSVSVVIPVLNGAATIGDMLTALMGQASAIHDAEIMVVDNGSTDDTQTIVRQFPVTLLHESRRGPAAARNRGLHAARNDIVAFADADTLPTRRWLSAIVAPFADPAVLLVGGHILNFRAETPAERYIAALGVYDPKNNVTRVPFPFAVTMNMAVRRSAALVIGGFAEDLLTGEDQDFSLRMKRQFSCDPVYQPEAMLFHRHRQTDADLWAQAYGYGEGLADLYHRHSDLVEWDWAKTFEVAKSLLLRSAQAAVLRAGARLGMTSSEQSQFAAYHSQWARHFWRGFFRRYRSARHSVG